MALVVINNYLHDLATAFWFVGAYLYYRLVLIALETGTGPVLAPLLRKISRLNLISIALVLIFGAVRTSFFMKLEWNPSIGAGVLQLLLIKHVILFFAVALGFWYNGKASRLFSEKVGSS